MFENLTITEWTLGQPDRDSAALVVETRDPLFTFAQSAKYLGKDVKTLDRLIRDGHIKKCPGINFIRKSVLDAYGK